MDPAFSDIDNLTNSFIKLTLDDRKSEQNVNVKKSSLIGSLKSPSQLLNSDSKKFVDSVSKRRSKTPHSRTSYSFRSSESSNEFVQAGYALEALELENFEDKLQAYYDDQNKLLHYRFKKRTLVPILPPKKTPRSFNDLHRADSSLHPFRTAYAYSCLDLETQSELITIANRIISPGKGILDANESVSSLGKRFFDVGLENNDENCRKYRDLLFTSDPVLSDYISGVNLLHETLYQMSADGTPFKDLLKSGGILIGIKVDKGLVPLFCSEVITQGLDDLDARCAQYKRDGCDFAEWRCVFKIGKHTPTPAAIYDNASILARYASICQVHGIVPIIEIVVLPDGSHDIFKARNASEKVMSGIYKALQDGNILLEGTLLKTNMVTPGTLCSKRSTPAEIATATLQVLQRTTPVAVAGIMFLSAEQGQEALINLHAINKAIGRKPWPLTFSYGRALLTSVLQSWGGKDENKELAQLEFLKYAKKLSFASKGWLSEYDITLHSTTVNPGTKSMYFT